MGRAAGKGSDMEGVDVFFLLVLHTAAQLFMSLIHLCSPGAIPSPTTPLWDTRPPLKVSPLFFPLAAPLLGCHSSQTPPSERLQGAGDGACIAGLCWRLGSGRREPTGFPRPLCVRTGE